MKRKFTLLFAICLTGILLTACSDDNGNSTPTGTFQLSTYRITAPFIEYETTIEVTTEAQWSAQPGADWITITPDYQNNTALVSFPLYTGENPRNSTIIFSATGHQDLTVDVIQSRATLAFQEEVVLDWNETSRRVKLISPNPDWHVKSDSWWMEVEMDKENNEIVINSMKKFDAGQRKGELLVTVGGKAVEEPLILYQNGEESEFGTNKYSYVGTYKATARNLAVRDYEEILEFESYLCMGTEDDFEFYYFFPWPSTGTIYAIYDNQRGYDEVVIDTWSYINYFLFQDGSELYTWMTVVFPEYDNDGKYLGFKWFEELSAEIPNNIDTDKKTIRWSGTHPQTGTELGYCVFAYETDDPYNPTYRKINNIQGSKPYYLADLTLELISDQILDPEYMDKEVGGGEDIQGRALKAAPFEFTPVNHKNPRSNARPPLR